MNNEWETPDELFSVLNNEFHFTFDAAANELNHKCPIYSDDSLNLPWAPMTVWLNPPYSRDLIQPFMEKAWKESLDGATVVALVRFDPSAKWFQQYVDGKASEVRMMARRVKFVGADSAYNFPTCVAVYRPVAEMELVKDTTYTLWDWK